MKKREAAFTLVELIVAILLGAMLMVATTSVMRLALATSGRVRGSADASVANESLRRQLIRDITHSVRFSVAGNLLELDGYVHRDEASGLATQRWSTVRYVVGRIDQTPTLFRHQATTGRVQVEPLWYGVSDLRVQTNQMPGDSGMPTSLRVSLYDRDGQLLLDETVRHHSEE